MPNFDKSTLIFDRADTDVLAIREVLAVYEQGGTPTLAQQDLWESDAKGCLNPSDLNRWGYAMNAIATSLQAHGYSVTANAKTNWANTDYMTQALNEAIINKLHELYTALNDLFIEESNLRAVFGGGQQTGLTTLPVSYAILAEPSWASLDLVDVDVNTLDYSTINDWNAIERFLYDALDFLERIGG